MEQMGKKSLRHVAMEAKFLDRKKRCFCKYGMKKRNEKKNGMYDFPGRDYTQGQNGSPYLRSIVRQCNQPSLLKNVTSYFSL